MKTIKHMIVGAVAASVLAVAPIRAQVITSADVGGLRTFQDVATGRIWLDLNNFFDESPAQMLAAANAAGFQLATFGDVQQLWLSMPLNAGQWSSYATVIGQAPNRDLFWGMFDSGTQASQGWGYAYRGDQTWLWYNGAYDWNTNPNGGTPYADLNLWAFRTDVVAAPEPASLILVGSGLFGIAAVLVRRRRA